MCLHYLEGRDYVISIVYSPEKNSEKYQKKLGSRSTAELNLPYIILTKTIIVDYVIV